MRIRGLAAGLVFVGAAFAAQSAFACAVPWTPPPHAVALERQVTHRREADKIALARVVEARIEGGRSVLLYDTVLTLDGAGTDEWAFAHFGMCEPNPEVGELVLLYYDRVNVTDPVSGRVRNVDFMEREVVRLADNVDPEIGPLLRQAAQRLLVSTERNRQLSERLREINK